VRSTIHAGLAAAATVAVATLLLGAAPVRAQGGPPLITDDPDTPGPRHWEINLTLLRERTREERETEAPRLDLNYGVGRRIQLKLEVPRLAREDAGVRASGVGDTTAGVKWRMVGEEHRVIAWSIYPQYEFNTSRTSIDRGLVRSGHELLLPSELTLEVKPIEVNLEVGRNLVSGGPDAWVFGLATEAELSRRLELVGEVHAESEDRAPTEWIVNVGARAKISRKATLMLAVGRAVAGRAAERPRLLALVGLQLNLPEAFDFGPPTRMSGR